MSKQPIVASPSILDQELDACYRAMALEEEREKEALEWAEATIKDIADEKETKAPRFALRKRFRPPR